MKTKLIIMKCITDLHVGSGDETYSFIDNEVEKDCLTKLPVIHSSGIKGALREFFENNLNKNEDDERKIEKIFGSKSKQEEERTKPGYIKFIAADLLARPVRSSKGAKPYYMVTTPSTIDKLQEWMDLVGDEDLKTTCTLSEYKQTSEEIKIEDITLTNYQTLSIHDQTIVGSSTPQEKYKNNLFVVSDNELGKIPLPVLARNELINGKSNNLWYEEIVPHESILMFPIICNNIDVAIMDAFTSKIDGQVIQFGGNASVGYGLCRLFVLG